ncbi:MAG: YihY/virulence factor BrkB family protein, partial [Actinomycetota bacterium]
LGAAILAGAALDWLVARNAAFGAPVRVAAVGARLVVDLAIFSIVFRVLTARPLGWRAVLPGATVATVGWEALQSVGALYVTRVLAQMSPTYGAFALVIGLLLWIALQCRVLLYAAEVNVVLVERLWPRSLVGSPTAGDIRARALRAAGVGAAPG